MRSCKHTLFPWNFFVINFSLVFSQFELDYLFQKEIIAGVGDNTYPRVSRVSYAPIPNPLMNLPCTLNRSAERIETTNESVTICNFGGTRGIASGVRRVHQNSRL